MQYKELLRILSRFFFVLLIPLSIPTLIAIWCDWFVGPGVYPQLPCSNAFLLTLLLVFLLGGLFYFLSKGSGSHLYRKESLLLVIIIYVVTPFLSALPFYLNGTLEKISDAYFESVSAYTTTGATLLQAKQFDGEKEIPIKQEFMIDETYMYSYYGTIQPVRDFSGAVILSGIEAVHPALLFWRSFMQCLGGGGIVILFVAILPALGVGGKLLFEAETTGPSTEALFPRIKETASLLWKVYSTLIGLQTVLLMITNPKVPLFDALLLSFSTLSTGGFAPSNLSVAGYESPWTTLIILIFMIFGSINFALFFLLLKGKVSRWNDPELKVFLTIILISTLFGAWQLTGIPTDSITLETTGQTVFSFPMALLHASFQLVSAQSSTGFTIGNFDVWPFPFQVWMLVLFYIGGMAGSTAGGTKIIRSMSVFSIVLHSIESVFRPDTIRHYRVGGKTIDTKNAINILSFIVIVLALAVVGTFGLVLQGIDAETSLSTVSCMLNNTGLAFRLGGPLNSFAFLPLGAKLISCLLMIAGRLEFFAVLLLFVPSFWKKI